MAVLWALLLLAVLGAPVAASGDPIAMQALQMTTDTPQITVQVPVSSSTGDARLPDPPQSLDLEDVEDSTPSIFSATGIQRLAPLSANPSISSENAALMINEYQTNLRKMVAEVEAQKAQVEKGDELALKLAKLQELNKDIMGKNQETVKTYGQELVKLVTKYTESLDFGSSSEGGEGEKKAEKKALFLQKLQSLKKRASTTKKKY